MVRVSEYCKAFLRVERRDRRFRLAVCRPNAELAAKALIFGQVLNTSSAPPFIKCNDRSVVS